ncbi:hypothetical protein N657DRAFT_374788 [Parathielavia appendiculata]|uniref:Uncharacterized protein n=1 Tax=Parathielavia appendiculata TaxID=2587402 RepID=A0AAN6YZG1_9PEZI|nr:hypothetical protein N657DRAFT_374788 [Parathielavia appendiculata]
MPRSARASGPSSLFYMQCILSRAASSQRKRCVGVPCIPSYPTVRNSSFRLGDDGAVGGHPGPVRHSSAQRGLRADGFGSALEPYASPPPPPPVGLS